MSTKSEDFRYESERSKPPRPKQVAKVKKPPVHAAKTATYAYEQRPENGPPSRKSTRGSANRIKADTNFNLQEELRKNTPAERHQRRARPQ